VLSELVPDDRVVGTVRAVPAELVGVHECGVACVCRIALQVRPREVEAVERRPGALPGEPGVDALDSGQLGPSQRPRGDGHEVDIAHAGSRRDVPS
jgi:hypothetical protein